MFCRSARAILHYWLYFWSEFTVNSSLWLPSGGWTEGWYDKNWTRPRNESWRVLLPTELTLVASILSLQQQTFLVFSKQARTQIAQNTFSFTASSKNKVFTDVSVWLPANFCFNIQLCRLEFSREWLDFSSLCAFHMTDESKTRLLKSLKVTLSMLVLHYLSVLLFVSLISWQVSLPTVQQFFLFILTFYRKEYSLKTKKLYFSC